MGGVSAVEVDVADAHFGIPVLNLFSVAQIDSQNMIDGIKHAMV